MVVTPPLPKGYTFGEPGDQSNRRIPVAPMTVHVNRIGATSAGSRTPSEAARRGGPTYVWFEAGMIPRLEQAIEAGPSNLACPRCGDRVITEPPTSSDAGLWFLFVRCDSCWRAVVLPREGPSPTA